jgi:cytochrome P450
MTSRVTSDLDPFSPEFRADPYPRYAELRALGPIVWLDRYGIWVVSHYEQVRAVLTDWEIFSNAGGGGLANYFTTPPWRPPSIILEADPPLHTRTRAVLMRVVSAMAVRGMRHGFQQVADSLIDRALRENLLTYGAMVFGAFGPSTPWHEELMLQAPAVGDWILAHCARDALTPVGLGASIHAAADTGEITAEEATLLVRSLLSAGVDTTIDSIGLALRCLIDHPDQWRLLRDDPSLARAAFEEATRYDSSSQSLFRTTLRAVEFAGSDIGKHEKVLVLVGSAGRDPARWDDPDRFDIRRKLTGQIGYGAGIHGCVAQMMARLEGEVFFQSLATKVKTLDSAGPSALRLNPGLRGLTQLPIAMN